MNFLQLFSNGIDLEILFKLLIAIFIGAFIGLEREKVQQKENLKEFGGIRTFTLISMIGFLSMLIYNETNSIFAFVSFAGLIILISINYFIELQKKEINGITSEVGAIMTYLIGVLVYFNYLLAIIFCIITALILSGKKSLHEFVNKINDKEFLATIEFAILACIVLPILPHEAIDPWGIFVPYDVWILILLILGISFIGYILNRIIGESKGTIFTGLIGGLASSTALTQSMSEKSKLDANIKSYRILACGTIIASAVMFIRLSAIISVFNLELFKLILLPISLMLFASIMEVLINLYILKKQNHHKVQHKKNEAITTSPFKIFTGIKFAVFFIFTLFIIEFANKYLGSKGLYLAAVISGMVDVDVFSLSMVKLAGESPALIFTAAKGVVIVAISNMFFKGLIAFIFGSRNFSKIIFKNFLITSAVGILSVFLLNFLH